MEVQNVKNSKPSPEDWSGTV